MIHRQKDKYIYVYRQIQRNVDAQTKRSIDRQKEGSELTLLTPPLPICIDWK